MPLPPAATPLYARSGPMYWSLVDALRVILAQCRRRDGPRFAYRGDALGRRLGHVLGATCSQCGGTEQNGVATIETPVGLVCAPLCTRVLTTATCLERRHGRRGAATIETPEARRTAAEANRQLAHKLRDARTDRDSTAPA
jgi:hypothetical protein